jgi:nickel-dependent lactate racemase
VVEVWLPYGASEIPARLPAERLLDILTPEIPPPNESYLTEARNSIEKNDQLIAAAKEAKQTCVALGASGKPELTLAIIRLLLEFLAERSTGNIVILRSQDSPKIDQNTLAHGEVVNHDSHSSPMVEVQTSLPFPMHLSSIFVNADLKIALGELKPHNLLKFEGLTDIVLPGLASFATIGNHLSNRAGLKLEDLYKERVEVGNAIPNLFLLGYTLPDGINPADITCGRFQESLVALERPVHQRFTKSFTKKADIVVIGAGGAPSDTTLSRAIEALPAGLSALKKNGSLILAAECENGHGDGEFYNWSAEGKEARYLEARIHRRLNYDGLKASLLRRALDTHRIYLVSTLPDHYVESIFRMRASRSISAALQTLQRVQGSDSSISIVPNGSRLIAEFIEPQKTESFQEQAQPR